MLPRNLRPLLIAAPLLTLLSACAATTSEPRTQVAAWEPKGEQQLSADQMRRIVTGNTSSGRMNNGTPYAVYYAPDGTQKVRTGQGLRDIGEWRVTSEGELCGKWKNIGRAGEETCLQAFKDGDAVRFVGGSTKTPVYFYEGNAAKL